VQKISQIGKAT